MVSLRSFFTIFAFTNLFLFSSAIVTWKSKMVQNRVLSKVQRKLQATTEVYVELCAPALGDKEAALVIVGGLPNLTDYRVCIYLR